MAGYIEGADRRQVMMCSFEDMVAPDAMVRVIDRFVDVQNLEALGFTRVEPARTGRPGYPPGALAKLYVYGYQNAARSSRKLERECLRNVEAIWLMDGLTPDYKTISEFRRLNIRPLQKLLRDFVKLCRSWELVGGELLAVDGSKFKASNSKKNNFSRKKLESRLSRLDEKIEEFLTKMDEEDRRGAPETGAPAELINLVERKEKYEAFLAMLDETGENEVSTVDPDARLMGNNRGGVDMAYNVQAAVDGKNDIIVEFDVSLNPSDQHQLPNMVKKIGRNLKLRKFTVLADKGYYSGEDLAKLKKFKVKSIISKQKASDPKGIPAEFRSDKFTYDKESDAYICPAGQTLGRHGKKDARQRRYFNKDACAGCPHSGKCVTGKKAGYRTVTRGQYADIYDETDKRFAENVDLYKRRQQIVEHPFGTVKRAMDGGYFLLRTRRKVRCEMALLILGYNMKRAMKMLGFKEMMARLDSLLRCHIQFSQPQKDFTSNSAFIHLNYCHAAVLAAA